VAKREIPDLTARLLKTITPEEKRQIKEVLDAARRRNKQLR